MRIAGRRSELVRVYRKGDAAQTPLYLQVYQQLRDAIERGALQPGERVTSARALARELRVSRNTIEAAVTRLVAEGLVVRRVGSGTVVASRAPATPTSPLHAPPLSD